MKQLLTIVISVFLTSCIQTDDVAIISDANNTLAEDLEFQVYQRDAVIACAANDELNLDLVKVFLYLEEGANDLRFYESNTIDIDPNDFNNYTKRNIGHQSFLDGSLRVFNRVFDEDQWIIVSYHLDNKIKLSSPIRTKNASQPSLYSQSIEIDQQELGSPSFDWEVESYDNNAVFFEVVYTINEEVLSRTYTNDSQFKYFDLSNVILNLTDGTPPGLTSDEFYNFLVMDVSIDNWVNQVYLLNFQAE